MVQGIIIVVFMVLMMFLMMAKKCPTLIALAILTIGISLIGGIPLKGKEGILTNVITDGSIGMASSYVVVLVASWLGAAMNKTKVSETLIRKAAEFGGDRTLVVTFLLFVVSILLCANINGLGAVIMIGTIVIPILISVGVDKFTAGCVMLMAVGAGNQFGLTRPTYIANALGIEFDQVYVISCICAACTVVAALVFISYRWLRNGKKFAFSASAGSMTVDEDDDQDYEIKGFRGFMAMLTPFIPIVFVAVIKWPIMPAIILGLIWVFAWTAKGWRRTCNLAVKTCYEGFLLGAPGAALMIFIGMLLKAINNETVSGLLVPITNHITPTSMIAFILFFGLLAPLSLYRGPLTIYGLGAGIAVLMISGGLLAPILVCAGFISNGCLQTTSCPTNTHNVWVASFVEEDVSTIMKKQMPYVWVASFVALVICVVLNW